MSTKKPQKAKVSKKRDVHTYSELWHGSWVLLQRAQDEPKGSYWLWMGSLIFTAFSFEAYLNHIGPKLFACWPIFEKVVSPEGKLDVVCERLGIELPRNKRPRQTVRDLFEFRNKLAHGRTVPLEEKQVLNVNQHFKKLFTEHLSTKWETYCTERNAHRAREDIKEIMGRIHDTAKPPNDPLFFSGLSEHSASLQ